MADEPSSTASGAHETIFAVGIVVLILMIGAMAVWYFNHEPPGHLPANFQMKVNVNTADAAVISLLPGVGESLAERMVKARNTGGAFKNLQDLQNRVEGLGPAKVQQLSEYLMFKKIEEAPEIPAPNPVKPQKTQKN